MLEKTSSGGTTKTISERKVFERITGLMVLRIALYFLFMCIYEIHYFCMHILNKLLGMYVLNCVSIENIACLC